MDKLIQNVAMVFMTCDSYNDAWLPFFKCLSKYWPDFSMPVYLCSETKYLAITGYDIRCPLKDSTGSNLWSKRLLKILKAIKEDYIFFTLEDFWLTSKVDNNKVNEIIEIMKTDSSIGYICMINEKEPKSKEWGIKEKWVKECEYASLWECTEKCLWRLTTQMGLWRKDYLIKMLRAHESAWVFEPLATWRSIHYSRKRVFDTKEAIFKYPEGGILGRGKVYEKYRDYYEAELLEEVISKRGLLLTSDVIPAPEKTAVKDFNYYVNVLKSYAPKIF